MDKQSIYNTIVQLVIAASSDVLSMEDIKNANGSLAQIGYNSLALTNLIVSIEETFSLVISPTVHPETFSTVDNIVTYVLAQSK